MVTFQPHASRDVAAAPAASEDALYAQPLVRYAAAVPLDHDHHHRFGAVVTTATGSRFQGADLLGWVTRQDQALAGSAIDVRDDVPVSAQGKPDRVRIADLLGAREQTS